MAEKTEVYDVIVVGAGISGVNAAYRIQTELPGSKYVVLESRGAVGGTWDFFRYPGIRSDSDLHTFGFPWRPWSEKKSIADGETIRKYIRETAESEGIDKNIRFHHKVKNSNWSSEQQLWTLTCDVNGEKKYYNARFIILGTGYYDYDTPMTAVIPGLEKYKGTIIHPQFWPEELDYSNKKMIVIGSGATAVTLLPSLAEKAKHVTMVQRSPGYLISRPGTDGMHAFALDYLPRWLGHAIVRMKFLILPWIFYNFCRNFPWLARKILKQRTIAQLPLSISHDPHFEPKYNPWEQRLCMCPDGDFFAALRSGKADVATGSIETVTPNGVKLTNGQELECDILVTATGLKIQMAGGASVTLDGEPVNIGEKFLWKGVMIQDVPNAGYCIGYTNASWTLGADACALTLMRIIKAMRAQNAAAVSPRLADPSKLTPVSAFNLSSTYVVNAMSQIPKAGDSGPWRPKDNYFKDYWNAKYGDIKNGLEYVQPVSS